MIKSILKIISCISGYFFWVTLALYLISILKISYLIPQLFSEATVVRYATNYPEYVLGYSDGIQYKNAIQWEILKSVYRLNIMVYGIYPFLLLSLIIICYKIKTIISYQEKSHCSHKKKIKIPYKRQVDNCYILDIRSEFIFGLTWKILSFSLGISGILITTFSIWGSR